MRRRLRSSLLLAVAGTYAIVGPAAGEGTLSSVDGLDRQAFAGFADDLDSAVGIGADSGQGFALLESQVGSAGASFAALGGFRPFRAPVTQGTARAFGGAGSGPTGRLVAVPPVPEPPTSGTSAPAAVERWRGLARLATSGTILNENLILSVIRKESGGSPRAVSAAGAMGLMQLMPGTARNLGVTDPFDPTQNVKGGTKFLIWLVGYYDGNLEYALAAYNCGHGCVNNALERGGLPVGPGRYARTVLDWYRELGGAGR